jgi:hypothetical protein
MPNIPRVGDLEIGQDLQFQRWEWIFQRVGWVVLVAIILAALAGLLGHGPLSRTQTADPDNKLTIEYNRFLQYHDPSTLTIRVNEGASGPELRLSFGRDYVEQLDIQAVVPPPVRVEAGADRAVYVFRVAEAGRPLMVTAHFEANRMGPLRGEIGIDEQEPARFRQFVYP